MNDKKYPFQDLGYICCSSYGRPRSRGYNFKPFKKLLIENDLLDIETSDNIIIYSHNMNNKEMFGELDNYKSRYYYDNHKIINFTTREESRNYEIIAVFRTTVYNKNCFKYYQFINSENKREFDTFINKCKEFSFYDTEVSAEYGDKLITLSTCEYSSKNSRLVIVAKKLN